MSDELYFMACLSKEQRNDIELLEMKACVALLDDQIVQLRRLKQFHSTPHAIEGHSAWLDEHTDEYYGLMASVAQSTSLARQLNARARLTISERSTGTGAHAN